MGVEIINTLKTNDYDLKIWQAGWFFIGVLNHLFPDLTWEDEPIDVTFTRPKFSVKECEEIAEKLTEFFKPYFEKYKINNKNNETGNRHFTS